MSDQEAMNHIAGEWLTARQIIGKFLVELVPGKYQVWYEHNAAAIIARLANAEPPLLLQSERTAPAPLTRDKIADAAASLFISDGGSESRALFGYERTTQAAIFRRELPDVIDILARHLLPDEEREPAKVSQERPTGFPFDGVGERQGDSH